MDDLPIPKQISPAPVQPATADQVTPPIVCDPSVQSAAPTSEPQGADRLRESGDSYPVTKPGALPPFSVPNEIGAIATQRPNSPHINRPVGPSSDDHHAGVPSASAATQRGSATIRDIDHGGKY